MDLLGELLLAGDHLNLCGFNTGEFQPIATNDCFQWSQNHVAHACVQMKPGKDTTIHSGFNRVTSSAVGRRDQIHDRRSDEVIEPVAWWSVSRALQHFPHLLVDVIR